MSWDVYLQNPISKETLKIGHHDMTGGTYIAGGTDEAWLNVTYNYGGILLRALGCPFRELNGRLASDTIPLLEEGKWMGTIGSQLRVTSRKFSVNFCSWLSNARMDIGVLSSAHSDQVL
jgi:hypothetical protein